MVGGWTQKLEIRLVPGMRVLGLRTAPHELSRLRLLARQRPNVAACGLQLFAPASAGKCKANKLRCTNLMLGVHGRSSSMVQLALSIYDVTGVQQIEKHLLPSLYTWVLLRKKQKDYSSTRDTSDVDK